MQRFGFIIHPIDVKKDVAKRFPALSRLPSAWLDLLSGYFPPVYLSAIRGIRSPAGAEAEGWLVACPLTPRAMKRLPLRRVYAQIVRAGRLAQQLGARIVGLGALTSAVGDAGITIARRLSIPVTTGNAYTVAVACESVRAIAQERGQPLAQTTVAILGATGSIGSACARLLHGQVGRLVLVGRRADAVDHLIRELHDLGQSEVCGSTDLAHLRQADMIISATNSAGPLIRPEHLHPGCAIYDLALPSDVSAAVRALGVDATVFSGGDVIAPGDMECHFDFGLPPNHVYACMAETIALALEGRYEDFTLGRDISPRHVREIAAIAEHHGFQPVPLRGRPESAASPVHDETQQYERVPQTVGAGCSLH